MITRIDETKSWFFVNITKIDKSLAGPIKKNNKRTQIHKIRNVKGEVTNDITEIEKYHETTTNNCMPRLNQKEIENMN